MPKEQDSEKMRNFIWKKGAPKKQKPKVKPRMSLLIIICEIYNICIMGSA